MKTEEQLEVLRDKELPWDEALAMRLAYDLHRQIGNNIGHYRDKTAKEFMTAIRNAVTRNNEPLPTSEGAEG